MGEIVIYKHMANSGDLIAALPGIQHVYNELGKKAVILQRLGVPASYYEGASHPIKDEKGNQVTMNEKQFSMLKPLLESLEYVEKFDIWEGDDYDISLDKIREGDFSTMGFGSINRWQFYTHPYLACDVSLPWLNAEPISHSPAEGKILLNFTSRYRNHLITYHFLREWIDDLIFAGLPEEHEKFCKDNSLVIPLLEVKDFLELTRHIQSCDFVLCGQSMVWNIAEGLKKRRVLEVCRSASNCVPNGPEGYDFLHQDAVQFYVKKFMS